MSGATPHASPDARLRYRSIRQVLLVLLALDLVLAAGKGLYGILSGSLGMISDGLHSAMHAAGGLIGLAGVALAARPPDRDHPYGYERQETLASRLSSRRPCACCSPS